KRCRFGDFSVPVLRPDTIGFAQSRRPGKHGVAKVHADRITKQAQHSFRTSSTSFASTTGGTEFVRARTQSNISACCIKPKSGRVGASRFLMYEAITSRGSRIRKQLVTA